MSTRPIRSLLYSDQSARKPWWLCLLIVLALTGCAAEMAFREGRELVAQDHVEEGLAKFREAMESDPRNLEYKEAFLQTRERSVYNYVASADRLVAKGALDQAEKLYQRALAIDPGSERAASGLRDLKRGRHHEKWLGEAASALEKKDFGAATLKLSKVLKENPHSEPARSLEDALTETAPKPATEATLAEIYKKRISIDFKDAPLKQIFEVVSRSSGLNFIFDKDVKADQKTSVYLKNSTIESVVHYTLMTNQLDQQILDSNTIMIYPNTAAKHKDYQEMVIRSFFLGNAEAKTVANTLKTILKTRDVVIDEKLNMLIVRDTPQAIKLAEKLVALHDVAEPEVMLEVEILEVKRTRLQELGIRWPSSLALTPLSRSGTSSASTTGTTTSGSTLTLNDLLHINDSSTGAALSPVTINARKENSDANLLANPRIRARNKEKAKILIGERVPNITTTATSTGFVSESINYVDVGLTLNVEPTIYLDNDVAIKVSLEVSNIVGQIKTQSGSLAYQIGTRTASTVLRLKDGENQVLAGLINDEDRRAGNKVPGLGELPIIGRLFGSSSDDSQKTEIVLSITPHLVRNIRRPDSLHAEFRSGTESSFRSRPDSTGAPAGSGARPVTTQTGSGTGLQPASTPSAGHTGSSNSGNLPASTTGSSTSQNPTSIGASSNLGLTAAQLHWQGQAQQKVGDTFALQLVLQPGQPLTGLQMTVGYDRQVVQVIGISEGDFLKQGGAQTTFSSRVDPSGQIVMTANRAGEGGATSAGSVVSLNFRTLSATEGSPVQLLTLTPVGVAGQSVSLPLPSPFVLQVRQ